MSTELHVDVFYLTLAVDIVLVDLPWITTAQPARGAVFTAAFATVQRGADDLLTFFFCGVFDQNRSHDIPPVVMRAENRVFSQQNIAKPRKILYHKKPA